MGRESLKDFLKEVFGHASGEKRQEAWSMEQRDSSCRIPDMGHGEELGTGCTVRNFSVL